MSEVTLILSQIEAGNHQAAEQLLPLTLPCPFADLLQELVGADDRP